MHISNIVYLKFELVHNDHHKDTLVPTGFYHVKYVYNRHVILTVLDKAEEFDLYLMCANILYQHKKSLGQWVIIYRDSE